MELDYENIPKKEVEIPGGICGTDGKHFYIQCNCGSDKYAKANGIGESIEDINDDLEFEADMRRIRPKTSLVFYTGLLLSP